MSKPKIRRIFPSGSSKVVSLPPDFKGKVGDNVAIFVSPDKKTATIVLVDIPAAPKPEPEEDK